MRFSFHTEQQVPYASKQVFAFFANPANLPLLMPAWQHARIERQSIVAATQLGEFPLQTAAAGLGSQITLSFRPLPGLPLRLSWDAEIAEFVWNEHFCDVQLRGPFAYWKHCHSIRPVDDAVTAATLVTDEVQYEIPFGIAGRLAHGVFLRRQIERTFAFRQSQLACLLQLAPSALQPADA